MEGFLRYRIGGLIHGGAYFRNFAIGQGLWKLWLDTRSKTKTISN